MQKLFIAGTVSSVKELKTVGQNQVFNFSVAVSNGKNSDGSWKDSTFWEVGVWGKRGEALARFLGKGTKVAVSGRFVQARVHDGRAYLSMDADEVTLLGGGEQGGVRENEPDRQANGAARYDEPVDEIPF